MVLSKASPLSLLLGLIHPGSPLWKSHFSPFAVQGNSARGVGRGFCSFIQLYPASGDGPSLPQPAGITFLGISVFPWTFESWVPPKTSSTLIQLKQRNCNLSPALPCYTFPFLLSFQWLQATKFQLIVKFREDWAERFQSDVRAVAISLLRRFAEVLSEKLPWDAAPMQMQELVFEELWEGSDQRCRLWALLTECHFTTNLFAHIIYLWIAPFLLQYWAKAHVRQ